MKKKPSIIGSDVPRASTRRKSDVFPGNRTCEIVEKKNADSPDPDTTTPTTVERCKAPLSGATCKRRTTGKSYGFVRERLGRRIHRAYHPGAAAEPSAEAAQHKQDEACPAQVVCVVEAAVKQSANTDISAQ